MKNIILDHYYNIKQQFTLRMHTIATISQIESRNSKKP